MRGWLLLATVLTGLLLATSGGTASAGVHMGAERTCKTGQFRCFALALTMNGKRVHAASPFVLPGVRPGPIPHGVQPADAATWQRDRHDRRRLR